MEITAAVDDKIQDEGLMNDEEKKNKGKDCFR